MAVWEHLNVDSAHIAYAALGTFSAIFSLVSLFVKEKLYIGEATVAAIFGLIVGPHCLNWFAPTEWGNVDYITLEVSRIVLCLQIFAVAVELPKKYMLKHWLSVFMLLVPVMTFGWLIVGLFVWILIPGLNFADSLVVSACITATDPVLAAAVVGKGKFAQRVPGHLRNLLSAESGCNDGMAFPFIYLAINLVIHKGNAREIVKDWICVTILYECIFGCILGVVIGYVGRHSIKFAERKALIDRESFLAFYVVLALMCAGFGSMLGTDDLLVSFAAGAAFSWDGWFAKKTEETHVSTVIDLLLNLAYFVYFGAIIPWSQFNDGSIGTNVWRLILLALVIIFLRRLPAVMAFQKLIPDIKTWREALFCGHFGPIGVGAVFAAILARAELEGAHTKEATPTDGLPAVGSENYQLIACIWPIVTFLVVSSIIVHGSSVAVITLGKTLNQMKITMSFTKTNGNPGSSNWMSRLPQLGTDISLQRVDTDAPIRDAGRLAQANTVETSGVPVRPAGGMERRSKKEKKLSKKERKLMMREQSQAIDSERLQREKEANAASFALGGRPQEEQIDSGVQTDFAHPQQAYIQGKSSDDDDDSSSGFVPGVPPGVPGITPANTFNDIIPLPQTSTGRDSPLIRVTSSGQDYESNRRATNVYRDGSNIIVEDQHGEILESASIVDPETLSRESTVASIASPLAQTEYHGQARSANKYIAYKLDNQLVIENQDGEIIRRYKINHHSDPNKDSTRTRSSTVASTVGKVLSTVGIKTSLGAETGTAFSSAAASPTTPMTSQDILREKIPEEENSGDLEEEEAEEEDDEEEEDDYEDEETEVEKKRRLQALGQIRAGRDYEDEEEDDLPQSRTPARSNTFMNSLGLKKAD
ncbi:hypothetical protein WICPIJ_005030 [Wickerhamomyces pijperi]|uniref:Na(+)/H(+) antiporter n=1 Tax=Wickerhamomyces pijperi TaxID=599730 RepID=A0A9P8Q4V1_WICPI|nr:hypothetical protein WICPIJ_005030 [Wickerhamomyces pijperi]